jgi:hypothetical protein
MIMTRTVAAVALALATGLAGYGLGLASAPTPNPYDQASFPCQEDEVLGYAPTFGPDHVGCIHIDQLP